MVELRDRIGKIVKDRRQAMEMSQEELAERIEKSTGFIGQIERGDSLPSIETLQALIHTLGINAELFFRENTYEPSDYNELFSLLAEMTPQKRELLIAFAKLLHKADI